MTTPTVTNVADTLFPDFQLASLRFAEAKAAFKHSPNGDRQAALDEATAQLDAVLDNLLDWR